MSGSEAFLAATEGDVEMLELLLESGDKDQYFSFVNACGNNVLHQAVISGDIFCVRMLVDNVPDLAEKRNDSGETPLLLACQLRKDLEIIKILCEMKETINILNSYGQTPLYKAIRTDCINIKRLTSNISKEYQLLLIKTLIDNGSDINMKDTIAGFTPLHEAIFAKNIDSVKLLLDLGAKVDIKDNYERTALLSASLQGNYELLKLILEKDPTLINVGNDYEATPLLRASEFGCENSIALLVKYKGDVIQTDRYGKSCIEAATKVGKYKNVAKLLEFGANPLSYEYISSAPLIVACNFNHVEIVKLLMNHESINNFIIVNGNDMTYHPLICAVRGKNPEILKLILNHPPFVDRSIIVPGSYIDNGYFGNLNTGVVSFLFTHMSIYNDYCRKIEEMLEMLLNEHFPVHSQNGSVASLTFIVQHFDKSIHKNILNMVKRLIKYGSDVYDMSLPICFWTKDYWNVIKDLRDKLRVPDVLIVSLNAKNKITLKYLIQYWPHPPVLLLLFEPGMTAKKLNKWFQILVRYGWPHGNTYAKKLEEMVLSKQMEKTEMWPIYEQQVQNPSSLRCLSRFAMRKILSDKMSEYDMTLPKLIKLLYIPPLLTSYLLMEY